jgi:hypothetical protein
MDVALEVGISLRVCIVLLDSTSYKTVTVFYTLTNPRCIITRITNSIQRQKRAKCSSISRSRLNPQLSQFYSRHTNSAVIYSTLGTINITTPIVQSAVKATIIQVLVLQVVTPVVMW